jgi:hypothetical protein
MTMKELREIIGAGRRRTGLYSAGIGKSFPLLANGEVVKTVILDHDVASFYGGQTGEKTLLRYVREPFADVESQGE